MKTGIVTTDTYLNHDTGQGHPERADRVTVVIDGAIGKKPYGHLIYPTIDPDEIAKTYFQFYNQNKSAWSWEVELRTSMEKF